MADKTETKSHRVAAPSTPRSAPPGGPTPLETAASTAFDPYRYQTHEVQFEDRLQWLSFEPPSIDRKAIEDTVPPTAVGPGLASPQPDNAERQVEEAATQTLVTPATVMEGTSTHAGTRQTSPSLRRAKREADELNVLYRANLRRRRAMIATIVGLGFVIGVGVFSLMGMGQDSSIAPARVAAPPIEAGERAMVQPMPTIPEHPNSPPPSSATPPVRAEVPAPSALQSGTVAPVAPALSAKVVSSANALHSGVLRPAHRERTTSPRIKDPQPLAPASAAASAAPPKPVIPTPKAPPAVPADGIPDTPVNPALE